MRISTPGQKKLKLLQSVMAAALLVGLSACQSSGGNVPSGLPSVGQNVATALSPNPNGEVFGQGTVRVALLLPKTAPGNAAAVANELRNGATMAMQDFGQSSLQLVIKDTKGHPADAQSAAGEAISEGSSIVIGPLFAATVSAASGITVPAGVSMLAFSTDSSIARRGVYLMSFTPEDDSRRMLKYAISLGRRSIIAFLPNSAEGSIRENVLRQVAGTAGATTQIIKYDRTPEGIEKAVIDSLALIEGADTIYIPEGGPVPHSILTGIRRNGTIIQDKQVLGSGAWESVKASEPVLAGALYPGRDVSSFNNFADRYETNFNVRPGVQAALGYDAITLVSELVRLNNRARAFDTQSLENRQGYRGVNGIFRLRPSGTAQRGLAIYQIREGKGQIAVPAPSSFAGDNSRVPRS